MMLYVAHISYRYNTIKNKKRKLKFLIMQLLLGMQNLKICDRIHQNISPHLRISVLKIEIFKSLIRFL